MKSIKKASLKLLATSFVGSMLALGAITPAFAGSSQEVSFADAGIASEYTIGSEFILPEVEAEKGGNSYATQ